MDKCNLNLKKYIGTKVVEARPMNEIDAESVGYARENNDNHEWREGYHVRYTNPDGSFYDSWSPKDVFEKAYQVAETHLDRMNIEYKEESERYEKGKKFIDSMNFDKLNYLAKTLLSAQNESQREYCYLLADRMAQMSNKQVFPTNYDFGTAIKFLKAGGLSVELDGMAKECLLSSKFQLTSKRMLFLTCSHFLRLPRIF